VTKPKKLTDLWYDEFRSQEPGSLGRYCGLCGNHGFIDTRGEVTTAVGVACGGVYFCICPNGRMIKTVSGGLTAEEAFRMYIAGYTTATRKETQS
jgi:hypothetical protein